MLPTIELSIPQLYAIDLKPPPEINKLITAVYDTSIDPLLYQLITAKTASVCKLPTSLQNLGQINIAALKVKENRLYYRGRLFVPNSKDLQRQLIQMAYNLQLSGYLSRRGTYKLFSQYYFWPKIIDLVEHFISAYHGYKRAKAFHTKY